MDLLFYLFLLLILAKILGLYKRQRRRNRPYSSYKTYSPNTVWTKYMPSDTKRNTKSLPSDLKGIYEKKNLLTKTEYEFYKILKQKCDEASLLICPKVRLEDFINVTAKEKMKYRGYIKSRHIDFLICDSNLKIIGAVELDDPSHNSEEAKAVDTFKNDVYRAIGIQIYRIRTSDNYIERIEGLIRGVTI